jgi:hypothetical protein
MGIVSGIVNPEKRILTNLPPIDNRISLLGLKLVQGGGIEPQRPGGF